jgi:hypothetical protein
MPADFVDSFLENVADVSSPALFKKWTAISTLAACMERRCWVRTRKGAIFPNLLVLLISSPGIGKTEAINIAYELWRGTKKLHVAPKRLTSASLVDALIDAEQIKRGDGKSHPDYEFHSLQMALPEFGTFIQAHDLDMLNIINDIYDNPAEFSERRRHNNDGKELAVVQPQLNILAGTQPAFLAQMLPEEAWGMGFTSRIVMVYAGQAEPPGSLWSDVPPSNKALVQERVLKACSLYGQFEWTNEAKLGMDQLYQTGLEPIPDHSKLVNYLPRRILHVMKLIMVSAVSRTGTLKIDVEDVARGFGWLIEAEKFMPDIFREMVQKSDNDVIVELHFTMWRSYMSNGEKPIHQSMIYNFLQFRVPTEKISRIIEVAERANFLKRAPFSNEHWIPQPKTKHGIE